MWVKGELVKAAEQKSIQWALLQMTRKCYSKNDCVIYELRLQKLTLTRPRAALWRGSSILNIFVVVYNINSLKEDLYVLVVQKYSYHTNILVLSTFPP